MASRKIGDCHLILQNAWVAAEKKWDELYADRPKPFLTCTYRSVDEQNELYRQGRENDKPRVTNAKGGQSAHNYFPSMAFDVAFIKLDRTLDWNNRWFSDFAKIICEIEPRIEWGGSWVSLKDNPHYQVKGWKEYVKQLNVGE